MSESSSKPTLVAIHGHLYQPPREDPWTAAVPVEPSAAPFHDWNERITDECYRPNMQAQFGDERRNNYQRINFDIGPTLTAWMHNHAPDVLDGLVAADRLNHASTAHGPAVAHPWVHAILPLCSDADKMTLIHWGIAEFEHRFGRYPEGMWLPETAMDLATLRAMRDAGIRFTMAAPAQVMAQSDTNGKWSAPEAKGDPLRISLGEGRCIIVVPYHGPLSSSVAFGGALNDGVHFANAIEVEAVTSSCVIVATDMESYGHHHDFGEMALVSMLESLGRRATLRVATVAEIVAEIPAVDGVLALPSAWSCAHGIERWRSDCGCRSGGESAHNQVWRAPLRSALDALRDAVTQMTDLAADFVNVVSARNAYVDVLLNPARWTDFAAEHLVAAGDPQRAQTYLELQRHLLMMYSSCGWFFDDAAGHETLIVLRHARRAIELVGELGGVDCEPEFVQRLAPMYSDVYELDGREVWARLTHSR